MALRPPVFLSTSSRQVSHTPPHTYPMCDDISDACPQTVHARSHTPCSRLEHPRHQCTTSHSHPPCTSPVCTYGFLHAAALALHASVVTTIAPACTPHPLVFAATHTLPALTVARAPSCHTLVCARSCARPHPCSQTRSPTRVHRLPALALAPTRARCTVSLQHAPPAVFAH
ncbi:hypothetical protein FIBSPDRAFT_953352 [Athelia psychrophila]|uniref:Uncharacterized protein n=1 Tax=Athelia psychrophila TaxID=1759441 RepID=A0A166KE51_9AGAM|nr:hypothetical protein FIBSPDRAFT_953352 [Fibularhizoctonia sp. CBS 109695]